MRWQWLDPAGHVPQALALRSISRPDKDVADVCSAPPGHSGQYAMVTWNKEVSAAAQSSRLDNHQTPGRNPLFGIKRPNSRGVSPSAEGPASLTWPMPTARP